MTVRRNKVALGLIVVAAFFLFSFLVPVIPTGGYGPQFNLPQQIFVQTRCYGTMCPVIAITGQCWESITYGLFGVGEYLFVNAHTFYYWAFIY